MTKKQPRCRDRRDVGRVVFLMEKYTAAREFSSCCVGTEAILESDVWPEHAQSGNDDKIVSTAAARLFLNKTK
ncbi:MAG: hypothetical protein ACR2OR_11045 [Hyphomicrobiales bacterium]